MVTNVLPSSLNDRTARLRGYIDDKGNKPFAKWFAELDHNAAARVTTALTRIEQGNFSNVKGVGRAFINARSTSAPDTGFISGKMATGL